VECLDLVEGLDECVARSLALELFGFAFVAFTAFVILGIFGF
jgi:hypothetical protein